MKLSIMTHEEYGELCIKCFWLNLEGYWTVILYVEEFRHMWE